MLNDHTDAEIARREHDREMGADDGDMTRWLKWCRASEQLLRLKSLDGNQAEDGYSLDYASDHFDAGKTPGQYAQIVRRDWEEARWLRHVAHMATLPKQVYLPALSVGSFDANGNTKGAGWWL